MDISLFRDLSRLAQTGSFSQAASLNNLSQPAFSRRIKSLEAWAGVTLADRSRQPVKLTKAGLQLLEAGLQALHDIEAIRSEILEAQSLPDRYVVTFGAQHSIGWRFFPAWLQALEENYGPLLSRLRTDNLPNCLNDLKDGHVDFVIAYSGTGSAGQEITSGSGFELSPIGRDCLVPVSKPKPDGKPLFDIKETSRMTPFLHFGAAAPLGLHIERELQTRRLFGTLKTVYENSMVGALRIRARAGEGLAWLPQSLVIPDLEAGLLVRAGSAELDFELAVVLLRNKSLSNHLTRSIWSFLQARNAC